MTSRRVCVCTKCYNIKQKIEALNKVSVQNSLPELRATSRTLSNITACPFIDNFPRRECTDRLCNSCGTGFIETTYKPLIDECSQSEVRYHQWELVNDTYHDKGGKEKKVKRWIQKEKKETVKDLILGIAVDMENFTSHIFRSLYQHTMEKNLMTYLPIDQCVADMDFLRIFRKKNKTK